MIYHLNLIVRTQGRITTTNSPIYQQNNQITHTQTEISADLYCLLYDSKAAKSGALRYQISRREEWKSERKNKEIIPYNYSQIKKIRNKKRKIYADTYIRCNSQCANRIKGVFSS